MLDSDRRGIAGCGEAGKARLRSRVAVLITEVCSPALIVVPLPYVVSYGTTRRIGPTLRWGTLVATLSSVAPMSFIVWGSRRGRWQGHHVDNRKERAVPLTLLLVSNLSGIGLARLLHAPRQITGLQLSMLMTLSVVSMITVWWKVSIHVAVVAGMATALVKRYSMRWLPTWLVVAAVAWARVTTGDHTAGQTIVGAGIGSAIMHRMYKSLV
jgi:hypothetical protein